MKKLVTDVLAEGEATGHSHRAIGAVVYEHDDGVKEFDARGKSIPVIHDEHEVIKLPREEILADRVIEFDHFLEEARKVVD